MSRIAKAAALTVATSFALVGSAGIANADADADAAVAESPGIISGNAIQVPIHLPVNICGITVNIIALLNPAFGNVCINSDDETAKSYTSVHHLSAAKLESSKYSNSTKK
ncbi:hypothetical protein GCM10027168_73590 [Streptomyces capparidis]